MALIQVTLSELQNAASKIAQANETFLEAATALKAAADALAETWEGTSHDSFVQEQEEIDKWYKMMNEVVTAYVDSMNVAVTEYNETDKGAAAMIRRG